MQEFTHVQHVRMMKSAVQALRQIFRFGNLAVDHDNASTLLAYRIYCLLAGTLVAGFWIAYRIACPDYIDPLWLRLALSGVSVAMVVASFLWDRVAASFDRWVFGLFCLLGVWIIGITALNDFTTDWAVGLLFVVAAVSLALSLAKGSRRRALIFQAFMILALTIAIVLSGQRLSEQLVLLSCVVGMAVVTSVASGVRRRMEEAVEKYREGLIAANHRAEEMLHLKAAFLNNMNHEIRTPLTGIMGYAEILVETSDPELQECARVIRSSGQRLMDTLSTILDLASLEAGEFDLESGHVDMESAANDAVALLQPAAEARGLSIEVRSSARPVVARGDHSAARRVIYNILSNAVKFTSEGYIEVRVFHEEEAACVEVVDTGIGIDPTFIPHLFGEFKQASTGLSRTHEGTGLGLTISKRLASLMEGDIVVQSKMGCGSTFTFALPAYAVHPQPAES